MWDVLLLFSSICTAVVVGARVTVTGHRGERVEIRCSYEPRYESNSKYFCKGECIIGNRNFMVKSGSPAKDERFNLTDDKKNRVFTVTITDLRTEDEDTYWCAVRRTLITDLSLTDVYSEILLQVKQDNKITEVSTISPFSNTSSYFSTTDLNPQSTSMNHTGSVIYVSAGLVIMVIIIFMTLMVWCRKRNKKSSRVTQSGPSQQVPVGLLPLNATAEISAEDIDWNDHNYQEISDFQCKNSQNTTIYSTAESPDAPMIYSTADKPEDPVIYSTADKPEDPVIYSTAEIPDDPMICR